MCLRAYAATCPPPPRGQTIQIPGHPFSAVPSTDGCWLFVSSGTADGGKLVVLRDTAGSFAIDHAVALPAYAFGAALSPDGSTLLVAGGAKTSVLDVGQLERRSGHPVRGTLDDGKGALAVYTAFSPDGRHVFVADERTARIDIFDLAGMQESDSPVRPAGRIRTTAAPVGMAVTADGHWLYATTENGLPRMPAECDAEQPGGREHAQGLLLRVDLTKALADPSRARIDAALPAGCNPVRVALSPDGRRLWVSARGSGALLLIDADSWYADGEQATIHRYATGSSPVGVAVRPDGKQVWTALSARFDTKKNGGLLGFTTPGSGLPAKQYSLEAAGFPRELAFLPDGHDLVATLYTAGKVMIVPTP